MNNKPGVFRHMMIWGLVSGTALNTLFFIFLNLLNHGSLVLVLGYLPLLGAVSLFSGGIPGAILGLTEAFFTRNLLADLSVPFTKDDMKEKRLLLYAAVFFVPIVLSLMLSLFIWSINPDLITNPGYGFVIGISMLIASIVSTYAAHRYMLRLHIWSKKLDARKSKAKNDSYYHLTIEATDNDNMVYEIENLEQKGQYL